MNKYIISINNKKDIMTDDPLNLLPTLVNDFDSRLSIIPVMSPKFEVNNGKLKALIAFSLYHNGTHVGKIESTHGRL